MSGSVPKILAANSSHSGLNCYSKRQNQKSKTKQKPVPPGQKAACDQSSGGLKAGARDPCPHLLCAESLSGLGLPGKQLKRQPSRGSINFSMVPV